MMVHLALIALQAQAPPAAAPVQLEAVEVVGRRGAARFAPEQEFGPADIEALGAYDIGEVISNLSERLGLPEPPVVIVNGRRVVDARNFTGFPPDALVRVEALPPQAGAVYGDPTRRVVNIVLQPAFKSRDGLAKASRPTAGGTTSLALDGRQSHIAGDRTFQLGAQIGRTTSLRADERTMDADGRSSSALYTLRPETRSASANIALTGTLGPWATSFNSAAQRQQEIFATRTGGGVVTSRNKAETLTFTGGISGQALGWSVRTGLDGLVSEGRQSGLNNLTSRIEVVSATLSADRSLWEGPAGPMLATVDARHVGSRTETKHAETGGVLSSRTFDLNANLNVPLLSAATSAGEGLGGWGDLSINVGGRLNATDDASTDGGWNAGAAWTPLRRLRLSAQASQVAETPRREQTLDPPRYGPPRTVYDFRSQEAVEIAPLLGGAPDLRPQSTRTVSLSASAGAFGPWRVQGNLDVQSLRASNAIGALPGLTPAVEAAFPERFQRNADGRLIGIDQRPINLKTLASETLSSGFSAHVPFGGDSRGRGSLQITLSHTWRLKDVVVIREGLPRLDQLTGDGTATPRHQLTLRLDGRYGRWGVNTAATWRGASRVRSEPGRDGADDLRLQGLLTLGVRLSTTLSQPRGARDGLRLEMEVENLFDVRQEARLGDGRPAPGYRRDDQDPLGRTVRVSLSRRF